MENPTVQSKNEMRSKILQHAGYKSGKALLADVEWEVMDSRIGKALRALLSGRNQLKRAHRSHLASSSKKGDRQGMTFALDGRLVGDIGELIAAEAFHLELLGTRTKNIDAVTTAGPSKKVQVKTTFRPDSLSIKHASDYFIGLQLRDDGRFRVVYNGPAKRVMDYLRAPKAHGHAGRRYASKRLEPITLGAWATLNLAVRVPERIPRRRPNLPKD